MPLDGFPVSARSSIDVNPSAPTLLLTGDADLSPPPPALRLFAARIAKSQTLMLREVGHSGYWEQPEQFNRAVLDFVKKHK